MARAITTARCRRYAPPAVTVAVAFDFQLLAELPCTPGDVRVSWIVTDTRTLAAT